MPSAPARTGASPRCGAEVSEPGKRRPGGQPVFPLGRDSRCIPSSARQAGDGHCRGPDRIASHCEAGTRTGATAAPRTASRLIWACLQLLSMMVAYLGGRRSRA